jgi:hypothetical protein
LSRAVDALIDLVAYTARTLPLAAVATGGVVASVLGAADGEALAAAGLTGGNVRAEDGTAARASGRDTSTNTLTPRDRCGNLSESGARVGG